MHCKKNLIENILKTICNVKEKDRVEVRRDMQRQSIRKHLWMMLDPRNSSGMVKPIANYTLIDEEFKTFCNRLEQVKVPSGYCVDIGSCIRRKKFGGTETYNHHVLMQTFLSMALKGLME